jgi:aspartate/methionine/tyrosine aminotransferase
VGCDAGSAGKSFSVTGWKVGWAIAPPHFTTALGTIHQFDCFTHGTPLQEAIAVAFEQAEVCGTRSTQHSTFHTIPHTFNAFLNRVRVRWCVSCVRCEQEKNYFPDLKQMYWRKRDKLVATLRDCGLAPVVPKGSYFVMADTSSIPSSVFMGKGKAEPGIGGDGPKEETRDYQFCRWLTRELGTAPACRVSSCRVVCVVCRGGC